MQDLFFINFFGLAILIGACFYFAVSIFIFTGVPEKSRATLFLGLGYLASGFLAFAYVPAQTIYHPLAAYHRWLTVPSAVITHIFYGQILYYMPAPRWLRVAKVMLIVQSLLSAIATVVFIYVTSHREYTYLFSGHIWDFEADDVSKLVALVILLNILHTIVAGVAHIIARKGQRAMMIGLFLAMLFAFVTPSVTNVLSRDGLLARDIHQTTIVLMSIAGLFAFLIIYLNHTTDKTTFMVKITGVSLVTFMVLMVLISFTTFQDKEGSYDALRAERTSRLSVEHDYPVADLKYLVAYNLDKQKAETILGESPASVQTPELGNEFLNTSLYERIGALQGDWRAQLREILAQTPPDTAGYKGVLLKIAETETSPSAVLKTLDSYTQQLTYRSIKISEIPDAKFREEIKTFIKKMPPELTPFADAIANVAERSPAASGTALKQDVLRLFAAFRPQGARHYRAEGRTSKQTHFTAFMKYSAKEKIVYEAGYSYVTYRTFIHQLGVKLTLAFLAGVLVIGVGFRFFFLGTLVRPLELLLSGVRKVNKGNLDVEVPVAMPDEIGFLTESFNSMVASIRRARIKLERYADELEEKVKERTAELSETLRVVQDLKHQQDGDYFLTSLLIKPLARNLARNQSVHVEFLIEQKKKFEFRKWKEEIGGDLCSAHTIQLKDKTYTVFVNADAMGKSMQGAGGALVLGAVFESLMERTRTVSVLKNQSPERWIKNAFQELQSVFESFDGSMLVSMVLGLVDEETGLLYYINVEHPWTVLYRNGKADFVEREHMFRKLGVSGIDGQIVVVTFQLEPDDVLLVGSDGRDDILLGTNEKTGERIINEDETLFLKIVEAGSGKLPQIHGHLEEYGALTDDLSLIRISYRSSQEDTTQEVREERLSEFREKAKTLAADRKFIEATQVLDEALALDPKSIKSIRMIVRILLEQKDYEEAFAHAEDYIYLKPMDTEMIYLASYLCKKLGRLADAAEFGERVRLRSPQFVRNLVNLAEVYRFLKNPGRARKIIDEALKVEPENAKALKVAQGLSEEIGKAS